jgi:hypothetical protein
MSSLSDLAEGMLVKFEARNHAREGLHKELLHGHKVDPSRRGCPTQAQRHADNAGSTLSRLP